MDRITSAKNPMIQRLRELKNAKARRSEGCFLVEGEVMIREALGCGLAVRDALAEDGREAFAAELEARGARACLAPRSLLEAVCDTKSPQGVCATFDLPEPLPLDSAPERIVALDGVQDPGNVGTIWRTADALGADGLILVHSCADPFSPKTVRSTMGACFRLPVYEVSEEELPGLLERSGLPLYATALRDDTVDIKTADLTRSAVVIGSEGKGVSDVLLNMSEKTLKIPMRERCESLNAAAAATIVLWQMGL